MINLHISFWETQAVIDKSVKHSTVCHIVNEHQALRSRRAPLPRLNWPILCAMSRSQESGPRLGYHRRHTWCTVSFYSTHSSCYAIFDRHLVWYALYYITKLDYLSRTTFPVATVCLLVLVTVIHISYQKVLSTFIYMESNWH